MTLKNFERFSHLLSKENLSRNTALKNRLKHAIIKGDENELISLGRETGYNFSVDDIWAYREKHIVAARLTDQDLESAARKLGPHSDHFAWVASSAVAYAVGTPDTLGIVVVE